MAGYTKVARFSEVELGVGEDLKRAMVRTRRGDAEEYWVLGRAQCNKLE